MSDQDTSELFLASWEGAEAFFPTMASRSGYDWLLPMGDLVEELRRRGFDQKFRFGHSLWFLVLSRSRKHGLRTGQPFVEIRPLAEGGLSARYELAGKRGVLKSKSATLTPQLESLLQLLAAEEVN
jgi:hypothetical protein